MRLLITGATGFIGQSLVPVLLKEYSNWEIMLLSRNLEKAQKYYPSVDTIKLIHVAATDFKAVEDFDPQVVIHLAAMNTSRDDTDVIHPLVETNVEYGIRLLDSLSRCSNMRLFVYPGSFAEYRYGEGKVNSAYLYAATKTAFRVFLDYYSERCHFNYITAVLYSVYGGNTTVKRLIDYMKDSLDSSEPIKMTGGEQILDFVHIDDVVRFFSYVVEHLDVFCTVPNGECFHIGTGVGTMVKDVAAILEQKYGKKCNIDWGALPYRERDVMYAVASIAKNLKFLKWKSQISLQAGL